MKDLMLDLETLGNNPPNGMITQIGACYFDRKTGEIGNTLSININIEDSFREGFVIEPGTVRFWLNETNRTFLSEPSVPVRVALESLKRFGKNAECVWSHATFDFVLIASACHKLGMPMCFPYRSARDIRTLVELAELTRDKVDNIRSGAHDALSDCIYQVGYCTKALNSLVLKEEKGIIGG